MPLHHRFFFFFFFLFTSISAKNLSDYCPETRCGNLTVKYPFYLESTAPSSSQSVCGYEGFGINCSTGSPILTLPSDVYVVKDIDYNSTSLSLVDTEIHFQSCPAPRHNVTLDPNSTLKLDPGNTNYTFLINCAARGSSSSVGYPSTNSSFVLPPINCLGDQYWRSYFLPPEQAQLSAQWSSGCNRSVVVPFSGVRGISKDGDFPIVVKNGFILDWGRLASCAGCEAAKGCCGRKAITGQFVCFCNDGPHDKDCNDHLS